MQPTYVDVRNVSDRGGASAWDAYWARLSYHPVLESEAAFYVERLRRHVELDDSTRVLDFGCGLGLVAVALAPHVASICLWDTSVPMRERAATRAASCRNVRLAAVPPLGEAFDVVLVNSVLQYLTPCDRQLWLRRWRGVVGRDGRVVLSDVPEPSSGFRGLRELAELAIFHARKRRLGSLFRERLPDFYWYWRAARAAPLVPADRATLRHEAASAGFDVELLPEGLTCRRHRLAALLRARLPDH